MKYMVIWWLLSNPAVIWHGACVTEAEAYRQLIVSFPAASIDRTYGHEVVPCGNQLLR